MPLPLLVQLVNRCFSTMLAIRGSPVYHRRGLLWLSLRRPSIRCIKKLIKDMQLGQSSGMLTYLKCPGHFTSKERYRCSRLMINDNPSVIPLPRPPLRGISKARRCQRFCEVIWVKWPTIEISSLHWTTTRHPRTSTQFFEGIDLAFCIPCHQ